MKLFFSSLSKRQFIDKRGKIFGRFDIFLPLFLIILLLLGFFVSRIVLEKDTYIEAELFASGGEWWWNNPAPPYWLADPIHKGSKEYTQSGKVLVEVVDAQKFETGERKMLWMKVKLLVTPIKNSKQYRFRREPLQIGSLIYVAPDNVHIASNVMWIEGSGEERKWSEKVITLEEYNIFPWLADAVSVGDKMKTDDGFVMAEILEKQVRVSRAGIVEWDRSNDYKQGAANRLNAIPNTDRRDITLKIRLRTSVVDSRHYFSYFQPIKVGFYLWIPLESANISGNIIHVE